MSNEAFDVLSDPNWVAGIGGQGAYRELLDIDAEDQHYFNREGSHSGLVGAGPSGSYYMGDKAAKKRYGFGLMVKSHKLVNCDS